MSDLVERLRALARNEHDDASIGTEAADEIERLTDALDHAYGIIRDACSEHLLICLCKMCQLVREMPS